MNFPDREAIFRVLKKAAPFGGAAALAVTPVHAQAIEVNGVWTDGGQYPQCTNVQFAERSILTTNPVELSTTVPLHPEISYAWQTLNMNGLYDMLAINLAPQKFRLRPIYTLTSAETKCLPDFIAASYRAAIQ